MDFDSLDASTQDYLLKWAETSEEEEKVKESLSLYPLTGEIIAIGMLNPDSNKGVVYFQTCSDLPHTFEEDNIRFECGTEKEILEKFWGTIKSYKQFVTFNGRAFDCPFILVRSAINRVRSTKNLMPNRYNSSHIDLLDQLTFYGASKRRFSLDMWCKSFGIKSPKADGITGCEVKDYFLAGRHLEIARYCAGDLRATKELLHIWENYIKFP